MCTPNCLAVHRKTLASHARGRSRGCRCWSLSRRRQLLAAYIHSMTQNKQPTIILNQANYNCACLSFVVLGSQSSIDRSSKLCASGRADDPLNVCPAQRPLVISSSLLSPSPAGEVASGGHDDSTADDDANAKDSTRTASPSASVSSTPESATAAAVPFDRTAPDFSLRQTPTTAAAAAAETELDISIDVRRRSSGFSVASAAGRPQPIVRRRSAVDRLPSSPRARSAAEVDCVADRSCVPDLRLPDSPSSPSRQLRPVAQGTAPSRSDNCINLPVPDLNRSSTGSTTPFSSARSQRRCSAASLSKSSSFLSFSSSSSSASSSGRRRPETPSNVADGFAAAATRRRTDMRLNGGPPSVAAVVDRIASRHSVSAGPLPCDGDDSEYAEIDEDPFFRFPPTPTRSVNAGSPKSNNVIASIARSLSSTPSSSSRRANRAKSAAAALGGGYSGPGQQPPASFGAGSAATAPGGASRNRTGNAGAVASSSSRTSARKQVSNQNPRPPDALFCLRLSNPIRKFCICFVEYKYPCWFLFYYFYSRSVSMIFSRV
jgi:hypothetical protein